MDLNKNKLIFIGVATFALALYIGNVVITPRKSSNYNYYDSTEIEGVFVLSKALDLFYGDWGRYPTTHEYPQILQKDELEREWLKPYIRPDIFEQVLLDKWDTKYEYSYEGEQPVFTSAGPDKIFNTKDDIYYQIN